jgi:MFS family permease
LIAPTDANRRWWTLVGACMGLFVLMLDSTVINVALPDIADDLDATTAGLQWVVNAYLLVIAAS